ncbi:MAG TPA: hypothetical protein VH436_06885 [Vicinamibacterales bacterium]|jgi:hypothetical protein
MTRQPLVLTAILLVSLAPSARAADGDEQPTPSAQVDVNKLPINVNRIQRQLRQTTVREERDGLNLRYIVDVYGRAPQLELFTKQDNLKEGAVPYGAPTHQDMLNQMTPQEYRAPAADFSNLLRWFQGKSKK